MTKELIFKYNCLYSNVDTADSNYFEIDFQNIDKPYILANDGVYFTHLPINEAKEYFSKILQDSYNECYIEDIIEQYDCGPFWMLKIYSNNNEFIIVRKQNEIKL